MCGVYIPHADIYDILYFPSVMEQNVSEIDII